MSKRRDYATRQQVYLERIKSGFVRDYDATQDELRKRTREVMGRLDADTLDELNRAELTALLRDMQQTQIDLLGGAMDDLLGNFETLAGYAAGAEALDLAAMTGARFAAPTASLAYRRVLAEPLHIVSGNGGLLDSFVKDWTKDEAARVANVVRVGWAEGKTVTQATRELVGTRTQGYLDGQLATTERKARAVIQTSTQHVASAARLDVYERNSNVVKGYRFIATLDDRTTAICRSLDRRVFEPGKGPVPPLHVNCRSTTIPELGPEFDFLDEGGTRASMNGQVDRDLTYYAWLKQQPQAFQDDAIGPRRAQLLRDGGLTATQFAQLNLGRNFEPLTLKEMRLLNPEAFKRAGL